MRQRVLLVEPDGRLRAELRMAAALVARVDADAAAPTARLHLLARSYDWLVTNLRLEAYNGLHLAYLAASARPPMRTLVYGERSDLARARACNPPPPAFFEARTSVPQALASYLKGALPPVDRRDPWRGDRRRAFRGGRRGSDVVAPAG